MKIYENKRNMPICEIRKEDGTYEHLVCDGSRRHVLSWSSQGEHCSEPNCEINKKVIRNSNKLCSLKLL